MPGTSVSIASGAILDYQVDAGKRIQQEALTAAGESSRPPRKPVSDEILALVKKQVALRTDASSVDQIRDMIKLARELDYRLVLENVHEGWLLPHSVVPAARVLSFRCLD